jgi:alpha-tubulin suppressor-like RCC1 family protein/Ca2+-binding EF-hand superfamily protein
MSVPGADKPPKGPSAPPPKKKAVEKVVLTLREQKKQQIEANPDILKEMTADDVFVIFDDDDSGLMSFEEFRSMLPRLGIHVGDAKAYRYFNICDTDGSGEIDVDEFKVALFACDPTSGNPVGFVPSTMLTPMDAFETFDNDRSGYLDEDEFYFAMEFLGLEMSDFRHEDYFRKLDINYKQKLDYNEFRSVFLDICDVRNELEMRDVDVPSLTQRDKLVATLEGMLNEEEDRERRALAEAKRYKQWIFDCKDKRRFLKRADFRSYHELRSCLDAAGQVYVFGGGTSGQFTSAPVDKLLTSQYKFAEFDRVVEVWRDRVQPQQLVDRLKMKRREEEQDDKRQADKSSVILKGAPTAKHDRIDPYEEALDSSFTGMNVCLNTAALWGKRIHHVAISENVMFALSDMGEVYSWGGNSYWWHEIQADSVFQSKWRGDTTPRSQLLLGTTAKELPRDVDLIVKEAPNMGQRTEEDEKEDWIKLVSKYFGSWQSPPATGNRLKYLEREVMSKIKFDTIKFSLECRGKIVGDSTLYELVEEMYDAILLEKKLLGEKAHKAIKETEDQVKDLRRRRKYNPAVKLKQRIIDMWLPLREVQAEQKAKQRAEKAANIHDAAVRLESQYEAWRGRAAAKAESLVPEYSPRGNSLSLDIHGITPRAGDMNTPRGYQAAVQVVAGAGHALLVHKSGQLYSWGVGAGGRLGLDDAELGEAQKDSHKPRLVQALDGRGMHVVRAACGFSHSAAVLSTGELFMWGSAANGKCGIGNITEAEECYIVSPTRVIVGGSADRRVRKVSCGAAHSAVVTETGQLYVFGLGDGGRLGQGEGVYRHHTLPHLANSLLHETVASVSCGACVTVALTEIRVQYSGAKGRQVKETVGGKAYIAGSGNTLGKQYDTFTYLQDMDGITIKAVSAGYQHIAMVTTGGMMYCMGRNNNNCCGSSPHANFLEHPVPVSCLYKESQNIAVGCRADQSSVYDGRDAEMAVNGSTDGDGLKNVTSTQMDPQAWWELDLGRFAVIDEIRVWGRTDEPFDQMQSRELYTQRLFPFWCMIGAEPFPKQTHLNAVKDALKEAIAKQKFTDNNRMSQWRCPANTQGRYVRIQLEGFNFLHLAEVQVFGNWGLSKGVGRVASVAAGRDVTVAVIRPSSDPADIETLYKRAVFADAANADVLRQLETYKLEYDKYGRGEEVLQEKCKMCRGFVECETCGLMREYGREIANMPLGIGGKRRRLKSIDNFLINESKPALVLPYVPRLTRPSKWDVFKDNWKRRFQKFFILRGGIHTTRPTIQPDGYDENERIISEFISQSQKIQEQRSGRPGTTNSSVGSGNRPGTGTSLNSHSGGPSASGSGGQGGGQGRQGQPSGGDSLTLGDDSSLMSRSQTMMTGSLDGSRVPRRKGRKGKKKNTGPDESIYLSLEDPNEQNSLDGSLRSYKSGDLSPQGTAKMRHALDEADMILTDKRGGGHREDDRYQERYGEAEEDNPPRRKGKGRKGDDASRPAELSPGKPRSNRR